MIAKSVTLIKNFLNKELNAMLSTNQELIKVSSVKDIDDSSETSNDNKIILSIAHLEQEHMLKHRPISTRPSFQENTAIVMNCYLLISANYKSDNYTEGLSILSKTLSLCNNHPVFTHENYPEMPESINKILLEIHQTSITDLQTVWSGMGVKYRPSYLFKVRIIEQTDKTKEN